MGLRADPDLKFQRRFDPRHGRHGRKATLSHSAIGVLDGIAADFLWSRNHALELLWWHYERRLTEGLTDSFVRLLLSSMPDEEEPRKKLRLTLRDDVWFRYSWLRDQLKGVPSDPRRRDPARMRDPLDRLGLPLIMRTEQAIECLLLDADRRRFGRVSWRETLVYRL